VGKVTLKRNVNKALSDDFSKTITPKKPEMMLFSKVSADIALIVALEKKNRSNETIKRLVSVKIKARSDQAFIAREKLKP
jgi:hypothetical protein